MKTIALTFLLFIGCHYGFSQEVHFTLVEPPKEQPWTTKYGMSQDPEGYLWLATDEGLYKYDGHQYTLYQHDPLNPNSLALNRLEAVFADRSGMIWISTFGIGIDRLDPVSNKFTHYRHQAHNPESLANDTVTSIIQDHDGIMWFGTNGGLERFDPKTGSFKHFAHSDTDPGSLSNNQVRVVYEDREGTLWAGTGSAFLTETPTGQGGLNKLNRKTGKFTRYMHDANNPHSLIENRIRAIFEDSRGTFWVGTTGDGLHTMDRKKGTFERHPYDAAHPEKLSRPALKNVISYAYDHITFINEDNSGRIWIGTYENGINVYDPSTQKTTWYGAGANSREKLTENEFWSAYKTRDGVLWIASWNNELYKINPYQDKLPYHYTGKPVYSFFEDSDNSLWMTTDNGLLHKTCDSTLRAFYIDKNTPANNNPVYHIEKDDENKLWLTSAKSLYLFDPLSKSFTSYQHQKGNPNTLHSDTAYGLKKGVAGKLWVGTADGLDLVDTKTKTFRHFRNDPKDSTSISSDFIYGIETGQNSSLWIATYNGLDKLDEKTMHFKRYLPNVIIYCLKSDSRGDLWLGTNSGLLKYDKNTDSFSLFGTYIEHVSWITEDHEKNLWLKTSKGIAKLNLQNNELNIYRKSADINGISQAGGYTLRNGEILYGDTSGYIDFYPGKLLHRVPASMIVIDRLLLADVPVLPAAGSVLAKPLFDTKAIKLRYNQSTFSFGFNYIDFVGGGGDTPTFYMLENYENKWRTGSLDETANYYNVPPGDYIFKVKTINSNGLVSERGIEVIISPPWWQRWWAYSIFVLLIAGSIWAFIYYRSLQLLKEKRVLEHKVQVRTEEVLKQKEEIKSQRDSLETQRNNLEKTLSKLKTTQAQLIQSEKMASLGELTAGIAHEIQNPLNFINNFSEVNTELIGEMQQEIDKGNLEEIKAIAVDIKQNQQVINQHGKRADGIVKGMLQHSKASSGTKEPININALADEYMRISYHGLRAKDKSFSAGLITHFEHSLPKINVVPQDMGRVMLNLFNNAFYAVYQKHKTAGDTYKAEVSVTTYAKNKQVVIKVKDNGVGIPDAIKEKIMQPFFTTKPTGEGTGLGLSLTYDMVVKGHGGSIAVNSVEGEGSEFIIQLPF